MGEEKNGREFRSYSFIEERDFYEVLVSSAITG